MDKDGNNLTGHNHDETKATDTSADLANSSQPVTDAAAPSFFPSLPEMRKITTYQAGVAQAAAHRTLQKYCDQVLKPYGITKMQWLIIGTVLDAGVKGLRISNLASALGTTMPYMTTSVNMLELKGVLDRSDNKQDSRSKLVTVSEQFAPQCESIERTLRDGLRKTIYADVDASEFRIYMKVLFQLRNITT